MLTATPEDQSRAPLPAEETTPVGADPPSLQRRLRILVVDDLTDAADSLAMLLRLLGHDARATYDGHAALQVAQEFHPHAVFLDLALPKLSGFEVAIRLRQLPEMQRACLIAISGHGQKADVQKAHESGFDLHLLKPVHPDRLTALLAELAVRLI